TFCSTRNTVMPRALMSRMMVKFSLTRSGDSPSEGSSTSSSLGARIRPRPIDIMACSPPDIVPASCVRRSPGRGEQAINLLGARARHLLRRLLIGADAKILLHRQLGKDLASLRDAGDAGGN